MIQIWATRLKLVLSLTVTVAMLMAVLSAMGCGPCSLEPKTRPPGVPNDAVWAGGGDGGAYVRCTVDNIRDVNLCSVWNDYTGYTSGVSSYKLRPQNRAAKLSELRILGAVDDSIYLQGGLILKVQ